MAFNYKSAIVPTKLVLEGPLAVAAYVVLLHNDNPIDEAEVTDTYRFEVDRPTELGTHVYTLGIFQDLENNPEDCEVLEIHTLTIEAPPAKKISTGSFSRHLRDLGFTVKREKTTEAYWVNVADMTAELPWEMAGKASEWYYSLIEMMAVAMGYSDLSQKAIMGKSLLRKVMTLSDFKAKGPKVLSKQNFLPKRFEEVYEAGNLYRLNRTLPHSVRLLFAEDSKLNVLKFSEVTEELFSDKLGPDEQMVYAAGSSWHFLVNNEEDAKVLLDSGVVPNHIWTIDRVVMETYLDVPDYNIGQMHYMLPGSKLEGDKLIIPVGASALTVEIGHVADPYLMPNDDPNQKVWTLGRSIFLKNHYVPGFGIVSDNVAVWAMINYVLNSRTVEKIDGKIAFSSNLFQQPFYDYAFGDNRIKTVAKGALGSWVVKSNKQELSPVIANEDTPEKIAEGVAAYLFVGRAAIANAQVTKGYVDDGAMMKGFAIDGDTVINANDNSKPGKTTNRGTLTASWQARVLAKNSDLFHSPNKGQELSLDFGDENRDLMVDSGFRIVGSRGVAVPDMGVKCHVWMTNWVLANGSGVATSPRKSKFQLAVRKRELFSEIAIPCEGKQPEEVLAEYFEALKPFVSDAVWPGDPLAWFKGRPICKFGLHEDHLNEAYGVYGAVVEVVEPVIKNVQKDLNGTPITFDFSGSLSVLMTYVETVPKMRKIGNKYTLMGEDVEVYELLNGQMVGVPKYLHPDIIVDTENAKQDDHLISLLAMFGDSVAGGIDYNIVTGLTDQQQKQFHEWRLANTTLKWIWTPPLDNPQFRALCEEYGARTDFNFDMVNKTVGQLCTVVSGDLVLSVETSTVRENVGTQAIIAEQLAALACVYRPLALDLWNKNIDNHVAVMSMLQMGAKGDALDAHWILAGDNNPELPKISETNGVVNVKKTFKTFEKAFPDGLTITAPHWDRDYSINLYFDALAKFSQAADSVGNNVIKLLQLLTTPESERPDGWDNLTGRLLAAATHSLNTWSVSKGNCRGVTRTDKVLHGRKIKPISRAWVKSGQVALNPNDPLVLMAKRDQAKIEKQIEVLLTSQQKGEITYQEYQVAVRALTDARKGVMAGDYILLSRSPMISVFMGEVIEDDRAPIGVYTCSDWDWHRGNEGDGDGDPSAGLRVPGHMVAEVKANLETSVFGPSGYYTAWGTNNFRELPIMDFYRGHEKKSLGYFPGSQDPYEQLMHREHKAKGQERSVEEVVAIINQIGRHYTRFVGKTFAMGSALVFKLEYMTALYSRVEAGEISYDSVADALQVGYPGAVAKVWRRCYEGLALSGISDVALRFASEVGQIGRSGTLVLVQTKGQDKFSKILAGTGLTNTPWPSDEDSDVELIKFEDSDATKVSFWQAGIDLTPEEATAVHWAIQTTALYSHLERRDPELDWDVFVADLPEHMQDQVLLDEAAVYGTLRRAGAGMHKRPGSRNSMISRIQELDSEMLEGDLKIYESYEPGYSIMGSVLHMGYLAQETAADIRETQNEY